MCPDTIQMCSMWNEARILTFHHNILPNCCALCILYGGDLQTESVVKDAQAMCASQLLFHEQRGGGLWECFLQVRSSVSRWDIKIGLHTIYLFFPLIFLVVALQYIISFSIQKKLIPIVNSQDAYSVSYIFFWFQMAYILVGSYSGE